MSDSTASIEVMNQSKWRGTEPEALRKAFRLIFAKDRSRPELVRLRNPRSNEAGDVSILCKQAMGFEPIGNCTASSRQENPLNGKHAVIFSH